MGARKNDPKKEGEWGRKKNREPQHGEKRAHKKNVALKKKVTKNQLGEKRPKRGVTRV